MKKEENIIMNTIPQIAEAIRKLETSTEINAIITAVKAQQKLIRRLEGAKAAVDLRIGQRVTAHGSNKGGITIVGTITKINRTKAIVDTNDGLYNVPLSMLQAA